MTLTRDRWTACGFTAAGVEESTDHRATQLSYSADIVGTKGALGTALVRSVVARIEVGMAKKGKGNKEKKAEKAAKAELKLAKKEAKQAKKKAKDPDVVAESEPEPEPEPAELELEPEPEPEPAELTQGAVAPADFGDSAGMVEIPPRKTATQLQAEVSARLR
eukprot:COSAG02_NODE_2025_length_10084_cov_8.514372_2_plen_163_part_00